MKAYRITLETTCEECKGLGTVQLHICETEEQCPGAQNQTECGEIGTFTCSDCDGSGYQEEHISLVCFL